MSPFTIFHVALSLLGIISGLVVVFGMLKNNRLDAVTAFFLITIVATSVTGFCFLPYNGFTPAQVFGIISMMLLGLAIYGRYARALVGPWRKV